MRAVFAVLLAVATATLYALSTSVQALEARRTPPSTALRASLLARLARRPLWLVGTAAGAVAWPMQAAALAVGSVALVQPALGAGLIVLLAFGALVLGESVGPRELLGVAAIVAAVAVLAWAAPAETGAFTSTGTWIVGLVAVALAPAPLVLRSVRLSGGLATSLAAGLGWAWVGLVTSLVDISLADRRFVVAAGWGILVGLLSVGALITEMTALQTWPATRAVPIAFGLEMLLPAVLAPALTHAAPLHALAFGLALAVATAGAVLVGSSRAVARAAVAPGPPAPYPRSE
jgi:multidrug transporter EmrE-like cation transporter